MPLHTKGWSSLTIRGNKPRHVPWPLGKLPRAMVVLSGLFLILLHTAWAQTTSEDAQESSEASVTLAPPRQQLRLGERLSFHGRWFGIPVGNGWIEVKAATPFGDRQAYLIEAQGQSNEFLSTFYPIHDTLRSYVDRETLQPLHSEKQQREGHYRADETVTFDYHRLLATYHSRLNGSTKTIPIPANVQDIVSAFYWLRTHPIAPPTPVTLPIYSDERVYETVIKPLQTLIVSLLWRGEFPCLVVEPVAHFKGILVKRGRVWLYVSADEQRIPLFVKIATPWGPITGLIDQESLDALRVPSSFGPSTSSGS